MMMELNRIQKAVVIAGSLSVFAKMSEASVLEEILQRIDNMGGSPLMFVIANIAETTAVISLENRSLRAGDNVIIGYDVNGIQVKGTAGLSGLLVSPSMATELKSGLAAGLYPLGSALYDLPPAGQLSLHNEAVTGLLLSNARSLAMSRIDGSVKNVINGLLFPELVPATLVQVFDAGNSVVAQLDIDDIRTTVLGAVNSGEIVTQLTAGLQTRIENDLAFSGISQGANIVVEEALARATAANTLNLSQIGGGPESQLLALNLASSSTGVSGAVMNHVNNKKVEISAVVTTVIGAVNDGGIGIRPQN